MTPRQAPTPAEEDGARAAMPGGCGERPGVGETLLSTAPPQDCYLITEQLQTNYMMVTPKPRSGNGTAGCQIVHACTGAHTRTHTPHETLGALWSGDRTRQREEPGPREVTGSNPHRAGSVPQFPHLGLGIPLPAAALPLPRGIDTAPCRATPAQPSATEPTPCTPKAPTVALPQQGAPPIPPALSHSPPLASSGMLPPSPGPMGLGFGGPCCSAAREHPPGSQNSPESRLPAGPGLWWHPDRGHPATPGTGQPCSQPPQTPAMSMCPGWLLTAGEL